MLGALGGFHLHFLYRLASIYATFAYVTALALFISIVAGAFFIKSPTFLYSLFKLSLDLSVFFFNTSTPLGFHPFKMLEPYVDLGVLQMVLPPTSWEMVISDSFSWRAFHCPMVISSLGGPLYGGR